MTSTPRITLTAVAAHAGVSVATASRALRARGEMRAETRARVLRSAAELGYRATGAHPGRPRGGTSRIFDLVLGHFHGPYADEIVAGARTTASELGYDVTLTSERDDPADDWPERIRSRGSAGIVLGLIMPTSPQIARMERAGIPIVLMEPPSESIVPLPSVRTTDSDGGAAAARHLIARGAGRFVVIGGWPSYRYGRARVEGFTRALEEAAPDAPRAITRAEWNAWDARRACARALAELGGDGPVGVFACSDEMAAGAYRAIQDAGLRIPHDVLVVGFDDVRGARWLHPPLTTIRQPIREMASSAVRTLARAAAGNDPGGEAIVMPTELVERGSTQRRG
ncbi:LacI family DNA-binding transcriptional regulator [Microbacterium karelineae]|uniref:LacI family DNA-binding transcriptional regulator n=1 Tax=Microbacterium karelineae TaxID=2654283 RepID=UPI0012EA5B47|nr:LacI family DNA-binding transcriptional regulator [Microbacterium karelineae]